MTRLSQGSFERAKFSCGEWFLCAKVYIRPDHAGPVSAGDRRNLYGVTEARLLLWLSRIHQCEGQRGVENLLCVYRREQTAEYGAELRPAPTGAERFLCADTVAVEPRWTRFITSAEWRRLLLPIPSLCVYDLHWSLLSSLVFEGEFTTLVSDPVGFKTPPERVKLCLEPGSKCVSVPSWEGMDTQLWAARNELYRRSGTDLLHFWCIHVRKLFKLHCLTMLQNMNLLYFKLLFS